MSTASAASPVSLEATAPSRILPSFSDLLFVMLMVWMFMTDASSWEVMLRDGDTGFHIRIGDWIRDSGAIPYTHPFALTVKSDWFAFEWLSEVAMSYLHSAAGLKGVALGGAILMAGSFALLFRRMLWSGANALIAVLIVLVSLNVNRIHALSRPHLFTWVFLIVCLWIFDRDRRSPTRWVYALAPLTAIWTNLHGGFLLFLVLLGLHTAALAAEAYFYPEVRAIRIPEARRSAVLMALCAVSTLANPYTYNLYPYLAHFKSGWVTNMVDEFRSPAFRDEPLMLFMGLLFVSLALLGSLIRARKWTEASWIVLLGFMSLTSVRHVTVFTLIVAPILAVEITRLWNARVAKSSRASVTRILDEIGGRLGGGARRTTVWPLVFLCWVALSSSIQWPRDFPESHFPSPLVRRHAESLAGKRVLASDQWTDYLIYVNYPRQLSFIDGQHPYFGQQHLLDYLAMVNAEPRWAGLLDRFAFDYILVEDRAPLVSLLRKRPDWKQIDSGNGARLFAKAL